MPDAGMLVLASDQAAAKAYAKVLKAVTGVTPTLALSEDPKASSKIDAFARGTDKFLVAVRMVSEGVDIPRCAVLVWLTSYRTPLFFAQAVGRVVRARKPGESATVFLPAVRPLLGLAAELETSRDHVLAPAAPTVDGLLDVEVEKERPDRVEDAAEYKALASQAQFAHVLFSGSAFTAGTSEEAADDSDVDTFGLFAGTGLLSPEQTAAMLAGRDKDLRGRASNAVAAVENPTVAADTQAVHEQQANLRREISVLVNRMVTRTGQRHADVHILLRKMVPGPPTAEASTAVLARRRDWLLSRLH